MVKIHEGVSVVSNNNEIYSGKLEDLKPIDISDMAEGASKRIVFGPKRFWEGYVMRYFTLPPKRQIAMHSHPWPHYILVIDGYGRAHIGESVYLFEKGCWAHVPGGMEHMFENAGGGDLRFICIVPREGDPHAEVEA